MGTPETALTDVTIGFLRTSGRRDVDASLAVRIGAGTLSLARLREYVLRTRGASSKRGGRRGCR